MLYRYTYIWELGFSGSSAGKESACNAGDPGLISGSGRSPGEGIGYPLQYSWASLVVQLVKNPPASGTPGFDLWVGNIPWRRDGLLPPVFLGFPCGSAGKESACNAGGLGSIRGLGRFPGEGIRLPTPLFWPGEFQNYSSWGCKESDVTEQL